MQAAPAILSPTLNTRSPLTSITSYAPPRLSSTVRRGMHRQSNNGRMGRQGEAEQVPVDEVRWRKGWSHDTTSRAMSNRKDIGIQQLERVSYAPLLHPHHDSRGSLVRPRNRNVVLFGNSVYADSYSAAGSVPPSRVHVIHR